MPAYCITFDCVLFFASLAFAIITIKIGMTDFLLMTQTFLYMKANMNMFPESIYAWPLSYSSCDHIKKCQIIMLNKKEPEMQKIDPLWTLSGSHAYIFFFKFQCKLLSM